MNQRIKLAEFVGWEVESGYVTPHGYSPDVATLRPLPAPRNDANDCEALIRKLNESRIDVYIECTVSSALGNSHRVQAYDCDKCVALDTYVGDDWKHGVCDLAEKIIDQAS